MIMSDFLSLKVVTPKGVYVYETCETVSFCVSDSEKGKGGGSYGIRKGHAKALFSLQEGQLRASRDGETIVAGIISSGFSTVDNNIVTVIVDEFKENN